MSHAKPVLGQPKQHHQRIILQQSTSVPRQLQQHQRATMRQPCHVESTPQTKTQSTDQIPEPLITPRSACFKTPPKGSTSRKRKGNPDKWKKTVRMRLRLAGEEYLNSLGIVRPKRQMKSGCGKCRYTSSTNINEEERQNIFASHWNLGSHEKQHDFICQRVSEKPTKHGEKPRDGI